MIVDRDARDLQEDVPCATDDCGELTDREHDECRACRGSLVVHREGRPLTDRQFAVLLGLADGERQAAIAEELEISLRMLKQVQRELLDLLGARTPAHAVAIAYHRRLLLPRRAG